eukprot:gnl/MRDRNA2_/MRDRNA2_86425_c0_seq1.p1 gnl/MRDRNA2_/MRDRNA2_86425_c0~~gnl/MRDRNA2_/MRDRNA2_86425_c0_seq1.p1  ORF type:complete len:1176 (+),score=-4.44 gnl/MRDRNA2_/MRDRNA2_86425_c0_seq1:420-3530(+)
MPAYLNALTGHGVHIVTVNDYLAARDANLMGQIYNFLGLSTGHSPHSNRHRSPKTQSAGKLWLTEQKETGYCKEITYITAQELAFDYLWTNFTTSNRSYVSQEIKYGKQKHISRRWCFFFAIVDEADFMFIDHALKPCVLSSGNNKVQEDDIGIAWEAAKHIMSLEALRVDDTLTLSTTMASDKSNVDKSWVKSPYYLSDNKTKSLTLTASGVRLAERTITTALSMHSTYSNISNSSGIRDETQFKHELTNFWANETPWLTYVEALIRAKTHYKVNEDYIIQTDPITGLTSIVIIDSSTGRLLPSSRWSDFTHQAIEFIEGCPIKSHHQEVLSITYEALFAMYPKLAGMSGTLTTEEEELFAVYDIVVLPIPTNKPTIRLDHPIQIFGSVDAKRDAILQQIELARYMGRPLLLGTDSVDESIRISSRMKTLQIPHMVMNAKTSSVNDERNIVARAGIPGSLTISTNMAGRGTDIVLGGDPSTLAQEEFSSWLYNNFTMNKTLQPIFSLITIGDYRIPRLIDEQQSIFVDINLKIKFNSVGGKIKHIKSTWISESDSKVMTRTKLNASIKKSLAIKTVSLNFFRILHLTGNFPKKLGPNLSSLQKIIACKKSLLKKISSYSSFEKCLAIASYFFETHIRHICEEKAELAKQYGGLLVMLDGMQRAKRFETQLKGRVARQGDPGESRHFVSMDESVFHSFTVKSIRHLSKMTESIDICHDEEYWIRPDIQLGFSKLVEQCQLNIERYFFGNRFISRTSGDFLFRLAVYCRAWQKMYRHVPNHVLYKRYLQSFDRMTEIVIKSHPILVTEKCCKGLGISLAAIIDQIQFLYQKNSIVNMYGLGPFVFDLNMYKAFTGLLDDKTDLPGILRILEKQMRLSKEAYLNNSPPLKSMLRIREIIRFETFNPDDAIESNLQSPNNCLLEHQSQLIRWFLQPIVGKILVNLVGEKISLLVEMDPSMQTIQIIKQYAKIQIEVITKSWSHFLDDIKSLQRRASLTTFATLVSNDEFKTETLNLFVEFVYVTRILMLTEMLAFKHKK